VIKMVINKIFECFVMDEKIMYSITQKLIGLDF
jgi:hypothetical protein